MRFLNSNLKKSRCCNVLFGDTVLKIINQFENKIENIRLDNKKKWYVNILFKKNYYNIKVLNTSEINKIKELYNEIKFSNINQSYIEDNNTNIDNILAEDSKDEYLLVYINIYFIKWNKLLI